ncbi:unnamed protein product [Ambrosiozyma monospora]|uniref:Unnamed protein product n=1 Tax=Ambrosiozyma monospora TaxID=43982 RepID=A0A9W6Z286_AMBMO|nr:unnamed protein product [Ambrosiozyma monospora]
MNRLFNHWSNSEGIDDDRGIVVIVPGLAGGVNEPQVRSLAQHLLSKGKHVAVLNCRGCCRTPITTPYLTSALDTDDLRLLVDLLHLRFPNQKIHLVGVSFGGVLITNYICEEADVGNGGIVTSVISICKPEDFMNADHHLTTTYFGKVFDKATAFFLSKMLKNNRKVLSQLDFCGEKEIMESCKIESGREFADKFTCKFAGFPSADSYLMAASPIIRTLKIKTPMLILNSLDDPIIGSHYPYFDVLHNPYLYMATCDLGGHYAFVQNGGDFWYCDVVVDFVDAFDDLIDSNGDIDDGGFHPKQTDFRERVVLY